jgi:hypothetical protein
MHHVMSDDFEIDQLPDGVDGVFDSNPARGSGLFTFNPIDEFFHKSYG